MKIRPRLAVVALLCAAAVLALLPSPQRPEHVNHPPDETATSSAPQGGPWQAFEMWYSMRAYPKERIPAAAFGEAIEYRHAHFESALQRGGSTWEPVGPRTIAGRILALAVDPLNPQRIWAGAASGGLWKTETAGVGTDAWDYVDTGFPSVSVTSILLDPSDPDHLWIGTGEVGASHGWTVAGTPGVRSKYGIGILESTDGGVTWNTTGLAWAREQGRSVQALRADPVDPQILWAATTEGLYKSNDAGATWSVAHDVLMAMDVVVDPTDGNDVFVSHGQIDAPGEPLSGLYRSTDGGGTWAEITFSTSTLPGRTELAISATGDTLLATRANATNHGISCYLSTDGGDTWEYDGFLEGNLGWYANAAAISPYNGRILAGSFRVEARSSLSYRGYASITSVYRGATGYVHPDVHAIAWDPANPWAVYVATDGGVFYDSGIIDWEERNGGLQTVQFYPGFATTVSGSRLLGGTQDNSTLQYNGDEPWWVDWGGDGSWCAIDPRDEDVLFAQSQYRQVGKSTDGGWTWDKLLDDVPDSAAFIAPLVMCPSEPDRLYAGALGVLHTTDGGDTWLHPDGDPSWNGTAVAVLGVSPIDADYVLAATAGRVPGQPPATPGTVEIRRSTNGGVDWTDVTSELPDRYPTCFRFDPRDRDLVWATVAGYGSGHVFRSFDAGLTWTDVTANLPDIPHLTVAIDPWDPEVAFVGTDLGIYRTNDGGASWSSFDAGLPLAHVIDLTIVPEPRRMIAATHGHGAWSIDLDLSVWADVTVPELSTTEKTWSAAWGDYDGDGDQDVFLSIEGPNRLLRNDGDFAFVPVSAGIPGGTEKSRGASWGDYDNDGDLDLYVANWRSANQLYRNDGGTFSNVTTPTLGHAGKGYGAEWVDYDRDGNVDLYLTNKGPNRLLRNKFVAGFRVFSDVTPDELELAGSSRCAGWADYDEDGDMDVYVTVTGGSDVLLRNDNFRFETVGGGDLGTGGDGRSSLWFDSDGDGDLDLYLVRHGDPNRLLRNDGNDSFVDVATGDAAEAGNSFGADAGDADNDGDLDLFVARAGTSFLLENEGDNSFTMNDDAPFGPVGQGRGPAFVDLDGDGALEIYVPKSGANPNRVLVQPGARGNWLAIDLVGTESNHTGLGATIEVDLPDGRTIRRDVRSGGTYLSRPPLRAHFGIGEWAHVDEVRLLWPSGAVTAEASPRVNRRLVLWEAGFRAPGRGPESAGGSGPDRGTPGALRLALGPNPFRESTTIELELPRPGDVQIDVFDVTGRRVRRLSHGHLQAGPHSFRWDGRDGSGRRVAAGVYFTRLNVDGEAQTRRIVILN